MRLFLLALVVGCKCVHAQPTFVTPIEGDPFRDWTIVNYVDRSPGSTVLDYQGGSYAYDAHLHFEVRHNLGVVDPFYEGLWEAPVPYAGLSPRVLDAGISDHFLSTAEFKEAPHKALFFEKGALCVHWVQLLAVDSSDVLKWEFYTPSGALYSSFSTSPSEFIRYGWYHAGWDLPGTQAGRWQSRFYINGSLFSELEFYASALQDSDGDGLYDDAERDYQSTQRMPVPHSTLPTSQG